MQHSHTYRAILQGDTLQWIDEAPSKEEVRNSVLVTVEIPANKSLKANSFEAVEFLQRIADTGLITDEWIKEWEEANKDRSLYGRETD